MTGEALKIAAVYRRELAEIRSPRILAVFGIFAGLQCILMMVSRSPGRAEDSYLAFMLGGLVAVMTAFDMIAKEREHHTIDLLLTQGITRHGLFTAKWLATLTLCTVAAAAAALGGIAGAAASGKPPAWGDRLAEFGMFAWLLIVYGSLSLACSTALRRGKHALIAASIIWVILRPPVIGTLLVGPISEALKLTKSQTWRIAACLPDFAFRLGLDIHRVAPSDVVIPPYLPYLVLGIYTVVFSLLAGLVFLRQDEPTI
jgi:ABC-type transport system involved in multi-copper enzyme maturation permease subunit